MWFLVGEVIPGRLWDDWVSHLAENKVVTYFDVGDYCSTESVFYTLRLALYVSTLCVFYFKE